MPATFPQSCLYSQKCGRYAQSCCYTKTRIYVPVQEHISSYCCMSLRYIHTTAHWVRVFVSVVNMHDWLILNQAVHLCMTLRYTLSHTYTHTLFSIQIQLCVYKTKSQLQPHSCSQKCNLMHINARDCLCLQKGHQIK